MIRIKFPKKAWDAVCFPKLVNLKAEVEANKNPVGLYISMAETEWVEPQTFLALLLIAQKVSSKGAEININLGDISRKERAHFLNFIRTQGFIESFNKNANVGFYSEKRQRKFIVSPEEFIAATSSFGSGLLFTDPDLIHARIVDLEEFSADRDRVTLLVNDIIEEMFRRSSEYSFRTTYEKRALLFQRIKTFISETILNVVEHASDGSERNNFAIYGRVRQGLPRSKSQLSEWHSIFNAEQRNAIALSSMQFSKQSEWIEIFVCDIGKGFLAHSHSWVNSNLPFKLRERISRNLAGKSPLRTIGPMLFVTPLSRWEDRHEQYRTSVTGLQAIAKTIRSGGAHIRVSDGVEGFGNKYPWTEETVGEKWVNRKADTALSRRTALGTFMHLAVQPFDEIQDSPAQYLASPPSNVRERILHTLLDRSPSKPIDAYLVDRRFQPKIRTSEDELQTIVSNATSSEIRVVIRLPKRASKQDFAQWVHEISLAATSQGKVATIVFADCAAQEAELYTDLLSNMFIRDANLNRVVVMSRMFDAAVFKQIAGAFKLDRELTRSFSKGTNQSVKIWEVAEALKSMDSNAFWARHESISISEVYKPNKCIWRSRQDGSVEQSFFGYLDIQTALLDRVRFETARRAFLRVSALLGWPEPLVTDSLIADVTAAALREFPESAKANFHGGNQLFLGSTVVSGETLLRKHGIVQDEESIFISFLIHRDAQSVDRLGSLLYWLAPEEPDLSAPLLKRVTGTPYVSEDGDYATTINRFAANDSGELKSLYVRSPSETYSDFTVRSNLKIGHFEHSNGHELFKVDLERILLHAEQGNDELWKWIIAGIEQERESSDGNWIWLFPSNQRNGVLFRLLSEHFGDKPSVLERFFVVTFLRNRTSEPFLISPLLEGRLSAFMSEQQEIKGATIVDMVGVTGRTNRQIGQMVQNCALSSIGRTVSVKTCLILDRSGLPIRPAVMTNFFARNRRYWRWDVPRLGSTSSCVLCQCLSTASQLLDGETSSMARQVVKRWTNQWELNSNELNELNSDVASLVFSPPVRLKFGVVKVGDTWKTNYVEHDNALTLAANLAELTRLTHRSDISINWCKKRNHHPEISILILSVCFSLFQEHLSPEEKAGFYAAILDSLWKSKRSTSVTRLGALLISGMSIRHFKNLEQLCMKPLFEDWHIENVDLSVAIRILDQRFGFDLSEVRQTEVYRANMSICGFWDGYFEYLCDFFDFFGWTNESQHYSFIRSSTIRYSEPTMRISSDADWEHVNQTIEAVQKACDLLANLADHAVSADLDIQIDLNGDLQVVSELMAKLDDAFFDRDHVRTRELLSLVHRELFGATGLARTSLVKRYQQKLLVVSKAGLPSGTIMNEPLNMLSQGWADYLSIKRVSAWRDWSGIASKSPPVPMVVQAGEFHWTENSYVFFDQHVIGAVYDTLLNLVHSPAALECPWDQNLRFQADCWWRILEEDERLVIELANSYDPEAVSDAWNGNKASYVKLERCGGKVHPPEFNNSVCVTRIDLPRRKN